MDRSFFEGQTDTFRQMQFFRLLHTRKEDIRQLEGGACYILKSLLTLDYQVFFVKQTVLPKNLLFLTFGAHFLCLISTQCVNFQFSVHFYKTEADPLRLSHDGEVTTCQILEAAIIEFSNLSKFHKILLFPCYIIPICMPSYISKGFPSSLSFLLSFHIFFSFSFCTVSYLHRFLLFCAFLLLMFFFFPVLQTLAIFPP